MKLSILFGILITTFFPADNGRILRKKFREDFVQIAPNLYCARYETSNLEYRQFQAWIHANSPSNDRIYQLDTAAWLYKNKEMKPFDLYYHLLTPYDHYPVVTLSYEAANGYCDYLTQQYNSLEGREFRKVVFRLPTETEWILATTAGKAGRIYSWDGYHLREKNGMFRANHTMIPEANIRFDEKAGRYEIVYNGEKPSHQNLLAEKKSFFPNEFGLYNTIGNAAEMVAEKGIAKGGSFADPGYDLRVTQRKLYDRPSPEIGFRVVMEVLDK